MDIYLWASDNESAAGLQVVDGVVVQVDAGDHGLDDLLLQGVPHLLQTDVLVVLDRDDDGVDAHRQHGPAVLTVLDCDLDEREATVSLTS